ncbi:MAG TPA: acyltransferase [Candidatus Angelobacter sp.]|nr:acyltransferase [Candidatus Angelobacter sp.]
MSIVNVIPYFLLMALFCGIGFLITRVVPFYSKPVPPVQGKTGYKPHLEGMRGILALSVFFHHAVVWWFVLTEGQWKLPPSNFYSQMAVIPVTLFFFLTGFLFWSKLLVKPKQEWKSFLRARILRLAPAYLGAMVLFVLSVAALSHGVRHESWPSLFFNIGRWTPFAFGGEPDINRLPHTVYLMTVVWSLRWEWLFYIAVPFLGWFAIKRWRSLWLIAAVLALFAGSELLANGSYRIHGAGTAAWFLRHCAYNFSVGIIVACLVGRYDWRKAAQSWIASVVALGVLGGVAVTFPVSYGYGALESIILGLPFLIFAYGNDMYGLLRTKSLVFLGQISYSVYMLHCLVLGTVIIGLHKYVPRSPLAYWGVMAILGIAVVLISTLSHRWLEAPFMHGPKTAQQKTVSLPQRSTPAHSLGIDAS